MLCVLILLYCWVYKLDIYLVTGFFMFNMKMFDIEKNAFLWFYNTWSKCIVVKLLINILLYPCPGTVFLTEAVVQRFSVETVLLKIS